MAGFYNLGNLVFVAVAVLLMLGQLGRCIRAQNSPQDYVDSHNNVRSGLGISSLVWDDAVAAYAQSYANQRVGDCEMKHSGGSYGENLYSAWISTGAGFNAADAVNSWVSERDDYDYANNACATRKVCGHYTQVVWRNSQRVGCGRVICNSGFTFITCNYDPPGNMNGERPY